MLLEWLRNRNKPKLVGCSVLLLAVGWLLYAHCPRHRSRIMVAIKCSGGGSFRLFARRV